MKKLILVTATLIFAFASVSSPVFASGDKVQGDLGQGTVVQEGPCPFGGDTPAGPNN